ncbi:MAG: NAD(P)-dependent glycerol-3-phosphate dehydrogenase [Limnohabitans sp.]|jgi:glycerol-3-phosphate dehydrogenase (NAD(P)+)|nr:NAD(P)-dependent glycerol-3-phosphate dehydrogenase [Limnohabitans sp.]MDP4733889.1 NAD(P)-dependent glycerol-3-phosphate dehydrogenase [Limnohabitans sp.]MDP4771157.1 NAD(P)-dependent glycerol-3-phosphate dehydrogenase [Limnohabitans sp.]MDP4923503.1 NAD(P)-dependent glycerol-3-phosphate dehydrogenase [Limnohabitans sp.]
MHITLIGAGAWGTAMALAAARHSGGHTVTLHARDAEQADALRTQKQNARYLPGVDLPDSIEISSAPLASLLSASSDCNLWVIATPMAGLRATLTAMANVKAPVAWLCKGLESGTGLMPHEVQAQAAPHLKAGALSGPSFALEVARQQPTALVAASAHAPVRDALVQAFHGPALRVYAQSDIVGVEVGGAVKNVLAIATGLCDGLHLGLNARAALITRGLAEMTRLGLALGAHSDTFMGLSGLGDLVLTATGELSRNRRVGLLLAQGQSLDQAVTSLGHVAEGVYSARTVMQRACALGVDMPITEAVVALLDARLSPREAVMALMGRDPKGEFD